MSQWTHSQCSDCWDARNPGHDPSRMKHREHETCCWCGADHWSGIYVRHDPKLLYHCGGHDD